MGRRYTQTQPPFKVEANLVWLVIAVVFIAAFGPILWLRPSARDKRLVLLRDAARKAGLRVEMRRYPKLDRAPDERVTSGGKVLASEIEMAVYLAPLDPKLRELPGWRIFRAAEGLPACPGWVFEIGHKPAHPALARAMSLLAPLMPGLPPDVMALDCDPRELGAAWLERPGNGAAEVAALADWLREAGSCLSELDLVLAPREQREI